MSAPERFEIVAERGFYRPAGCVSLEGAVELITTAITFTRARGLTELVANGLELTGFGPPNLGERFFLAVQWATAGRGVVRLAVVVRPELIDSEKFGVMVARNRGLVCDVFTSEAEAVAWLEGLK
jgi:hypothetical protein